MINMVVETLATAIDVLFLAWFVPKIQQASLRKRPWSLVWIVLFLAYQLIADHFLQGFDLLSMAGVATLSLCFSLTLKQRNYLWPVFSTFAYVIVLMLTSSLVYALFSLFIDQLDAILQGASTYLRIIYILICKIVQFAFFQLILQIFKKNQNLDLLNGILSFLYTVATAFGLGSLMKIAAVGDLSKTNISIVILAFILVLMNIILYVMLYQVQNLMKSKYALKLMQERMDFEKSRMEDAQTIWENIRKTKHDLKNHFTVMKGQLEDGNISSCKEYLNELNQTVESMGNLIRSGNSVIDYLINSKLSNLDGVQVLISGYVGNYNDLDHVDLACILGNILDNAVEAQEKVAGIKRIELMFAQKNAGRIIICKNTIAKSVLCENRRLRSTKASPDMHGLGHQIVETTVKKYQGWVDYFEKEGMFGVQIILPVKPIFDE